MQQQTGHRGKVIENVVQQAQRHDANCKPEAPLSSEPTSIEAFPISTTSRHPIAARSHAASRRMAAVTVAQSASPVSKV